MLFMRESNDIVRVCKSNNYTCGSVGNSLIYVHPPGKSLHEASTVGGQRSVVELRVGPIFPRQRTALALLPPLQ